MTSPLRWPRGRCFGPKHQLSVGSALLVLTVSLLSGGEPPTDNHYGGRAAVYHSLPAETLDLVGTKEHLLRLLNGGFGPFEIQRTFEHAEKIECFECIPSVAQLLLADDPRVRSAAAEWLRHRPLGVLGAQEPFSNLRQLLLNPQESELHRQRAAEALGRFHSDAAQHDLESAAQHDGSAEVRSAAVEALGNLGVDTTPGVMEAIFTDPDETVRLAGLRVALYLRSWGNSSGVAERLTDESARVRRKAAEVLGLWEQKSHAHALAEISFPEGESDPMVRQAAITSLGTLGATDEQASIERALTDPVGRVRDAARAAQEALRRFQ